MHSFIRIFILTLFGLAPISALQAQGTAPAAELPNRLHSPSKRTDVYHVFFGYAVPGKAAELLEFLKTPDPNASGPSHSIILRHQDGDAWDYVRDRAHRHEGDCGNSRHADACLGARLDAEA